MEAALEGFSAGRTGSRLPPPPPNVPVAFVAEFDGDCSCRAIGSHSPGSSKRKRQDDTFFDGSTIHETEPAQYH